MGRKHVTVLHITALPNQLPRDWLSNILVSLPSVAASVSLFPVSRRSSITMVERFMLNLSSEAIFRSQSGRPFDNVENQLERVKVLSEEIRADITRLFYASILLAVVSDSQLTLKECTETTEAILRADGVSYSLLEYGQLAALSQFSLDSHPSFEDSLMVSTHSLPALMPFTQSPLLHREGTFLGINAIDGSPVVFDRFTGLNFNAVIVGKSGSGKSFFAKITILRESNRSGRCFVIDPLGEFLGPCLQGGGVSIDVFNEGLGLGSLTLSHLTPLMFYFTRFLGALLNLSEADVSMLKRAISARLKVAPGERVKTVMEELGFFTEASHPSSQPREGTAVAAFALRGEYPFRNACRLIVFDLSAVPKEAVPDTISLLCGMVFEHCKHSAGRKTLVVDEAWTMSKKRESAESIAEITRHSRHFELSVVLISQNFDDFLCESYGESLLNNCSSFYVFRHERVSERMLSHLEIRDEELAFLSASTPKLSGTGRCLFVSSGRKIPLFLPADSSEQEICRTDGGQMCSPYMFVSRLAERSLLATASALRRL